MLKGFRARQALGIRPSSRTDERGRPIKVGGMREREKEGGEGQGYLLRRLDSKSRSWIFSPGTLAFSKRDRERESKRGGREGKEEEEREREQILRDSETTVGSVSLLLLLFAALPEDLNE